MYYSYHADRTPRRYVLHRAPSNGTDRPLKRFVLLHLNICYLISTSLPTSYFPTLTSFVRPISIFLLLARAHNVLYGSSLRFPQRAVPSSPRSAVFRSFVTTFPTPFPPFTTSAIPREEIDRHHRYKMSQAQIHRQPISHPQATYHPSSSSYSQQYSRYLQQYHTAQNLSQQPPSQHPPQPQYPQLTQRVMSNTQTGHAQERVTKGSSASAPRKVKFNVGKCFGDM